MPCSLFRARSRTVSDPAPYSCTAATQYDRVGFMLAKGAGRTSVPVLNNVRVSSKWLPTSDVSDSGAELATFLNPRYTFKYVVLTENAKATVGTSDLVDKKRYFISLTVPLLW